jgi:hypothetical protein
MLVACRLANLSALETYYGRGQSGRAMQGRVGARPPSRNPLGPFYFPLVREQITG